jgi:Fe-S cluster assembly protein SufD
MSTLTAQEHYLSSFSQLEAKLPGQDAAWLKSLRLQALEQFKQAGFPTDKLESWKYTNLSLNLLKEFFTFEVPASTTVVAAQLKKNGFDTDKAHLVVFVNGKFSKELSSLKPLEKGMTVQNLASVLSNETVKAFIGKIALSQNKAFTALNTAFFTDGLFVQLEAGKVLDAPVHAVYVSTNGSQTTQSHLRNLLVLANDSKVNVIEHYWGENVSAYLTNVVTEVAMATGSTLDHLKIGQEDIKGYHIGSLIAQQEEGSYFASRLFSVGGALTRNDIETTLGKKKAECVLEGLYLAKEGQHVDTRTFIDHLSPNCNSTEVFKGVIDDQAVGVFDGRILVRENAQKTDARQSNKNLLLTKEAKIYSKPQFQIYADDVKCSHGSATGQIDEEALFYLQSRGISRDEAKKVLVYAFAGEMVEKVESGYLKPGLKKLVDSWMEVS